MVARDGRIAEDHGVGRRRADRELGGAAIDRQLAVGPSITVSRYFGNRSSGLAARAVMGRCRTFRAIAHSSSLTAADTSLRSASSLESRDKSVHSGTA